MNWKEMSFSARAALVAAALTCLAALFFIIYGAAYHEYFDIVVLLCDLLAIGGFVLYAAKNAVWSEYLSLAAVFVLSFGMGLFFLNSYPVWADWYGHFTMYGSRGGLTPVVIQLLLVFLALIGGIVSCFCRKGGKNA